MCPPHIHIKTFSSNFVKTVHLILNIFKVKGAAQLKCNFPSSMWALGTRSRS